MKVLPAGAARAPARPAPSPLLPRWYWRRAEGSGGGGGRRHCRVVCAVSAAAALTVIRPLRRGVGGPNGTLFFQTDRGAAAEHVDPGP